MRLFWFDRASHQLEDAVETVARDNPTAARKWKNALLASVDKLKLFPDRGRRVSVDGRRNIRQIIFGNYRIIYRRNPNEIGVLSIRHTKRRSRPAQFVHAKDHMVSEGPIKGAT